MWTDTRVQLLTVMWEQGYHASEIAEALGEFSTSAVLSKVHRLNLPGRRVDERSPVLTSADRRTRAA